MSDWDYFPEIITRIDPNPDLEYQLGTIVHANFHFGGHYAIVYTRSSDDFVDLLVVSSREYLEGRDDCVEVTPSDEVPFKRVSFIKCDEIHRVSIEDLETVYSGLLPQNYVLEIEALLERG
tara:strand:+ start:328 stop:690 length:363 start_codon:yes stop_codon:yes gene_type:complete